MKSFFVLLVVVIVVVVVVVVIYKVCSSSLYRSDTSLRYQCCRSKDETIGRIEEKDEEENRKKGWGGGIKCPAFA